MSTCIYAQCLGIAIQTLSMWRLTIKHPTGWDLDWYFCGGCLSYLLACARVRRRLLFYKARTSENCTSVGLLGRHRWVEYASKGRYNASQVPPEWHGWLHFITDHTGDELLMLKPKRYGVEHKENLSGEGHEYIYHSKGHTLNPGQRDWTRYQPWEPTKV